MKDPTTSYNKKKKRGEKRKGRNRTRAGFCLYGASSERAGFQKTRGRKGFLTGASVPFFLQSWGKKEKSKKKKGGGAKKRIA